MAAQKQPKPELIAIYRLEFYKKQKKWKLSADARKEKEAQKCVRNTKVLNETYCIETNTEDEMPELNDAFLKDDSDKESPVTSARTLKTQLLEPIHACQECQQRRQPQSPWADCIQDPKPTLDTWKRGILGLNHGDILGMEHGDDEFDGFNEGWEGMEWTNSVQPPDCTGDATAPITAEPMPIQDEEYPKLVWEDNFDEQIIPWPDDLLWHPEIWDEDKLLLQSLEDVEEFLIGAHNAPHSSEIELCVPDDIAECELESNQSAALAQLSGQQLAATMRQHAAALHMLLEEEHKRRYRSTLSLDIGPLNHYEVTPRDVFSTDYSYEVFPTRDTGFKPLQTVGGVHNTPNRQVFDGVYNTPVNTQAFDRPQITPMNKQAFDGPQITPMNKQVFDGPQITPMNKQAFDGPQITPMNKQAFDGSQNIPMIKQAFDEPQNIPINKQAFDGPQNIPMNRQAFDGPQNIPMNKQVFDGPQNIPMKKQAFDGPQNIPMNRQAFDGPQNILMNKQAFDGPQNIRMNTQAFDGVHNNPMNRQAFDGPQNIPMNRQAFEGVQNIPMNRQAFEGVQNIPMNRQAFKGVQNIPMNRQAFEGVQNIPTNKQAFEGLQNTPMNRQAFDGVQNTPMNRQAFDGIQNTPLNTNVFVGNGQVLNGVGNIPLGLQNVVDGFMGETLRSFFQIEFVGRGRGRLPSDGQMGSGGI